MSMHFDKRDKYVFSVALLLLLVFSYLLYDDSYLMDFMVQRGRQVALIKKSENDVRLKAASDFRWNRIHANEIYENDSIFTGKDSEVTVVLQDQTEIHLKENTMITFRTVQGQLVLGLQYGQISGQTDKVIVEQKEVAKPVKKSIVSIPVIQTPEYNSRKLITFDIYGKTNQSSKTKISWTYDKGDTLYEVEVSKSKDFKKIELVMTSPEKEAETQELTAGTYYARVREKANENSPSKWSKVVPFHIDHSIPEKLDRPELLTKNFELIFNKQNSAHTRWTAVKGADEYVLTLINELEPDQKQDFVSSNNDFNIKNLKPGFYQFYVQARNNFGLRSDKSDVGVIELMTATPLLKEIPPQVYILKHDEDPGEPTKFQLQWTPTPESKDYAVEISKTPDFKKVKKLQSRNPASFTEVKTSGKYYWRVRSVAANGKPLSKYSQPGEIIYQYEKPLRAPALIEPMENVTLFFQKKNQNIFHIEWGETKNAQSYSLQVAQDADFKNVVLNKQVSETRYLLKETLPSGQLYWRVRAETNERQSDWSAPRKLSILSGRTARGR